MRGFLVIAVLLAGGVAHAQPVRVNIECEQTGRTKTCPAFLLGIVDAHPVLLQSPRASADVVVYASAAEVALVDRVHLRFVGTMARAPSIIEIDVEVDTRADDDAQRAQLEPAFLRGIALFVAARFPKLVTVELGEPQGDEAAAKETTPWDIAFEVSGFGSRSGPYQSYSGGGSLELGWVEPRSRAELDIGARGGLNRQPPLVLDDGTEVSVNSKNWHAEAQAVGAWLLNQCYSIGGAIDISRDDPKGQLRYASKMLAAVEWDRYRADDPRGNRLAVMYAVGYQVERYNVRNELGERFAHYPIHAIVATGRVRRDKVGLDLSVFAGGEILRPKRRHELSASPSIEWKAGDHVDFSVSFSITKRELPAPDETQIDPTDYETLSRLSYAEPFAMNGSFSLTIHWDRTNGARNDRLGDL